MRDHVRTLDRQGIEQANRVIGHIAQRIRRDRGPGAQASNRQQGEIGKPKPKVIEMGGQSG